MGVERGARPWAVALACVVLAGAMCWAPSAWSQETGSSDKRVLVLPLKSLGTISSIIEERIAGQLREKLEADKRVETLPRYEDIRKKLAASGQSSAAIAEAEALYTSGIGLLTAGENKKAAETFQRAVDMMMANLPDLQNYNVLSDALANLSLAYYNSGFDIDARKTMKKFAHMRPKAKLVPEDKYPDELKKILAAAQAKVAKAGPGKLSVDSDPPGATIYVDGVEKGITPATVSDVGFGYHYLVLKTPEGMSYAEEIRVRGKGKAQSFKGKLKVGSVGAVAADGQSSDPAKLPTYYTELLQTISKGQWDNAIKPNLHELATQTGATHVAWPVLMKKGMRYEVIPFVYQDSDQTLRQLGKVTFNYELSNLVIGVTALSASLVATVLNAPSDKVVASVNLRPKRAKPAVAAKTPGPAAGGGASAGTGLPTPQNGDPGVGGGPGVGDKLNTGDDDEIGAWVWIGATAGVVVLAGIVAGTVFLLSDNEPEPANGFSVRVSWEGQ